jgi:hypothetical protein
MSKYYFEGSPILAPLTIHSKDVVVSSETVTLKRLIHKTDAQRWDLSFGIVANDNEDAIFLAMIENAYTLKTMDMPQLKKVDDATTMTGGLSVSSNYVAGATSIQANNTSGGLLPKGSFIQFANHTKVYVIKSDYVSNGNSLEIYPALKQDVSGSDLVYYGNFSTKPQLNYLRDDTELSGINYSDGILVSIGTVTIKEVV